MLLFSLKYRRVRYYTLGSVIFDQWVFIIIIIITFIILIANILFYKTTSVASRASLPLKMCWIYNIPPWTVTTYDGYTPATICNTTEAPVNVFLHCTPVWLNNNSCVTKTTRAGGILSGDESGYVQMVRRRNLYITPGDQMFGRWLISSSLQQPRRGKKGRNESRTEDWAERENAIGEEKRER